MKCPKCTAKNPDDARTCSRCGATLTDGTHTPSEMSSYLPNYLAQAVLATIFCCMPLGAVALIFAAQVNGRQIAGEYEKAQESSMSARLWCWIAFGVGLAFWSLYIVIWIIIMVVAIIADK